MPAARTGPIDRVHPVLVLFSLVMLAGLVAASGWLPLAKKGIFPGRTSLLVAARNLALADTLMMESEEGVVLSSGTLMRTERIDRPLGNRLSIWAFALWFRWEGTSIPRAHLFGGAMMGLAVAILTATVYLRLGYRMAFCFGLAWLSMPTFLAYLAPGHAEIPLLFLSVSLLAVLGTREPGAWRWLVAGIGVALAAASKLTFAFYAPIFLLWAIAVRAGYKTLLAFLLPLPVAGVLYFGPERFLSGEVAENYTIVTGNFDRQEHPTFDMYGAVYPDPWTFRHPDLRRAFDEKNVDRFNKYHGFTTKTVPWTDRMRIHAQTVEEYLKKATEIRVFGGPLVLLGMLLGAIGLWRTDRQLLGFLALTLAVTTLANIFTLDARGEHRIVEIGFVFAIPLGAGLAFVARALTMAAGGRTRAWAAGALVVLSFLLHQGAAAQVAFARIYSGAGQVDGLARLVRMTREKAVGPGEIVAMGAGNQTIYPYNLYTDLDVVAFGEGTVKELLEEGELAHAFRESEIRWAIGYSPEISRRIEEETDAKVIADRVPGGE